MLVLIHDMIIGKQGNVQPFPNHSKRIPSSGPYNETRSGQLDLKTNKCYLIYAGKFYM